MEDNDYTTIAERPLSSTCSKNSFSYITGRNSGTFFSEIVDRLKNKNSGESLIEIKKCLASFKKEKKLILLTQKLNEIEAEKVVGFLDSHGLVFLENTKEAFIQRQIIQESKLIMPLVRVYSGANYAVYQSFIQACKHIFCTRSIPY